MAPPRRAQDLRAEALAHLATSSDAADPDAPIPEIAGPRVERLVDAARLLAHAVAKPKRGLAALPLGTRPALAA